jgi:hypothetical protein
VVFFIINLISFLYRPRELQASNNPEDRIPLKITLNDAYSHPYYYFLKSSSSSSSSSSTTSNIIVNQTLAYFIGRTFLFLTKIGSIFFLCC